MAKETAIDLPTGFVVYANLTEPKAFSAGAKPKYDLTLAWPESGYDAKGGEWAAVKRAVHGVAVAAWGDKASVKRAGEAAPYRVAFRRGREDEKHPDRYAGYVVATLRTEFEVPVVADRAGKIETVRADFLARGMAVSVAVKAKAYQVSWRGITMYPFAVCVRNETPDERFMADMERGGGGRSAVDHFTATAVGGGAAAAATQGTEEVSSESAATAGGEERHDPLDDDDTYDPGGDDDVPF